MFGGRDLKVSNVIFSNAREDPWKHASILNTNNTDITLIDIDCEDCGHCIDLKVETAQDPQILKASRQQILDLLASFNN